MADPTYIRAFLDEIGGTSCGTLSHRLERVEDSDPPDYLSVPGVGNFLFARCQGQKDGNGDVVDYNLTIVYYNPGQNCHGTYADFYKTDGPASSPPASPTGDYCRGSSGSVNCGNGQAHVVSDD